MSENKKETCVFNRRGRPKGSLNKIIPEYNKPYKYLVEKYNPISGEWEFLQNYKTIDEMSQQLKIIPSAIKTILQGRTKKYDNVYKIFHIDIRGMKRLIKRPRFFKGEM
jgi:hypothetical protein